MDCFLACCTKYLQLIGFIIIIGLLAGCGSDDVVTLDESDSTVTTATGEPPSPEISRFNVGGSVIGLSGSGLVLQNSGGDDLSIDADGDFTFATSVIDGGNYLVSIGTQPGSPAQSCTVSLASGTIDGADVSDVLVNCLDDIFVVSGITKGLSGSGLVLQLNGADDLEIATNGNFRFDTFLADGIAYAATVLSQPTAPSQVCTIINDSGVINAANAADLVVDCSSVFFTIGGSVTGLAGAGLTLENNNGDDIVINADGNFVFPTALADGSNYAVTVQVQPNSPNQVCVVGNANGTLAATTITNVAVACTTVTYTVGGNVTGLAGSGLVLQNNAGDDLAIAADGSFVFATPVDDSGAYAVTVQTQPTSLNQTCSVTTGAGSISSSNVSNVAVSCVNDSFTVGGTVSGLTGSGLVLQNNGGDNLPVTADGSFVFGSALSDGSSYNVTVQAQPGTPSQTCSVTSGSNNLASSNVTNVAINCVTDSYTVSGFANGVAGSGLVLQNNAGDDLSIAADGIFAFSTGVTDATNYTVSVLSQPSGLNQTCSLSNASGTISSANVNDVALDCVTTNYTVGGTVSGLSGTGLVLENKGGDDLAIAADGSFTFTTSLPDGDTYVASVGSQPGTPAQTCTASNGNGLISGANVTNVTINCVTDSFTVGGTVTGLNGSGLVLQNNAGDNLAIAADGSFNFSTPVVDGNAYTVTVFGQPSTLSQTCSVTTGSGNVSGADVTDVVVNCINDTFTIGGTVTGLAGSGLTLENNNGDDLLISADGLFTFSTASSDGSAYNVSIQSQPGGPDQTCTVTNAGGILAGANVSNVTINCVTETYTVGGFVFGMTGSGMVLQNNLGDDLSITGDGSFTFATALNDGSLYDVTVLTQPGSPTQSCSVSSGGGNLAGSDVNNVVVSCAPVSFSVGGTVTGLAGGGLVLQNNGGDDLAIGVDGSFTFSLPVNDGDSYSVSLLAEPSNLSQTCFVTNESGSLAGGSITDVLVECTTNTYTVGGIVTGYSGSGLVIQNNAGDDLAIGADGSFSFPVALVDGSDYAVSVLTAPAGPVQGCNIANAGGRLAGGNVTNVTISCTTTLFTVGGMVSGYTGSSGLVLQNNGADDLVIAGDGSFTFSSAIGDTGSYAVSVLTQPNTPDQNCNITNNSGVLAGSDVTNVTVSCVTTDYSVGGVVTGLTGLGLVLQNNGGDDLPINANGSFVFPTALADTSAYEVTVSNQPGTPSQTCAVTSGTGNLATANVTSVNIACTTDTYTIGGDVFGLSGTGLVLQSNGADDLAIAADGSFTFTTPITDGTPYAVSVLTNPSSPSQICSVSNAGGTLGGSNITNVIVNCGLEEFSVSGFVTGLSGSGLVLRNNGGDDLSILENGSFTFPTEIPDGGAYAVTVQTSPNTPSQSCTVTNGNSSINGIAVIDVVVDCSIVQYTVGGTVSGLLGSGLMLENNAGDDLAITGNGVYVFATALDDGSLYNVSVQIPPGSPTQTCTATNSAGTLAGSNVTNVDITCVTDAFTIGGTVTGLAGTGLVLQNNGGDDLAIAADGSFNFTTPVSDGNAYIVTVTGQPTTLDQTCSVNSGSGNVSGGNVSDVTINCSTTTYTVGGTVTGLLGTGLTLENNNGDDLAIAADGSFTFTTAIDDGSAYSVSVANQPSGLDQTCTVSNAGGLLAGGNVGNVDVTCVTNSYTVGGVVSGLAGTGLVLQNNGGDDLAINANGSFSFASGVSDGAGYAVSIFTPSTGPSQTCSVSAASGTISGGNVGNVIIDCVTNSYTVGGTVSGLAGSGMVLRLNGGDDLAITANGNFTFSSALLDTSNYLVSIATSPSAPSQNCAISNGNNTLNGANVTDVSISCTTNGFFVGGSVTGLNGDGLVLQNNAGDDLALTADGSFTFATAQADLSAYAVTVLTQPTTLNQICSVINDSGNVAGVDVSNIQVSCVNVDYTVGGTVNGLLGEGLVLENNGGDDLSLAAVVETTNFALAGTASQSSTLLPFTANIAIDGNTRGRTGGSIAHTSNTAPSSWWQVDLGAQQVIDDIRIWNRNDCCANRLGNTYVMVADTPFPADINDFAGSLANADFTFQLAATESGHPVVNVGGIVGRYVRLQKLAIEPGGTTNNGGSLINIAEVQVFGPVASGAPVDFTFLTALGDGSSYNVGVQTQPTNPKQTCTVTNDSGNLAGSNVTDVVVNCVTDAFSVGGIVSGIAGTGLVLQNNSGDDLAIAADGSFEFTTPVVDGDSYSVSVLTQPTGLSQTCTVTGGDGDIASENVSNILVSCAVDRFTINGTVNGLLGSGLVLENNGGDDLSLTAVENTVNFALTGSASTSSASRGNAGNVIDGNTTGNFHYQPILRTGGGTSTEWWQVDLGSQRFIERIKIWKSTDSFDRDKVDNVYVLVADTPFPADRNDLAGSLANADFTFQLPAISAGHPTVDVGGVTGRYVRLQKSGNNPQGNLLVLAEVQVFGPSDIATPVDFSFAGTIADGSSYTVNTVTQPGSPSQTCTVSNETGTVSGSNVINVTVNCVTDSFTVGGTQTGLAFGDSVVLQNNGADDLILTAGDDSFTFPTSLLDRSAYAVTILNKPVDRDCSVTNGDGTLSGSNITNVLVTCVPNIPPEKPVVTASYSTKTVHFDWPAAAEATNYHVSEDINGISGYTLVSGDLEDNLSYSRAIPFLPDHLNARYIVTACNIVACVDSDPVFMDPSLRDAIGYFKALNRGGGDFFSRTALSDDGNTLVVGARSEDSSATGVNGVNNNSSGNSGAAYVFVRDPATNLWTQQAYLKASNRGNGDLFGIMVAVSGDGNTLVVGAQYEDSNATGVDGNGANNSVRNSGAAYVFTRTGETWSQQAYIKASNPGVDDLFGRFLSLDGDGDTLAVSAYREDSNATGIDGVDNNSAANAGAVYVFNRTGSTWAQQAYVKAAVSQANDEFGIAVSLSADGDSLAVGARYEDGGIAGINGDASNNARGNSGAAYVFTRTAGVWSQQTYLKPDVVQNGTSCGFPTVISGDGLTLVAGCSKERSNAIGINGDQTNTSMIDAGAVYVWIFDGGVWQQQAYIKASNTQASDSFGLFVGLSNDGSRLVAGAHNEDSATVGLNGNDADNAAANSGAAYLFYRDGGLTGTWSQHSYIKAPNTQGSDSFKEVAISGDGKTLAVGASNEDGSSAGVGGDQSLNNGSNSGAVYLY